MSSGTVQDRAEIAALEAQLREEPNPLNIQQKNAIVTKIAMLNAKIAEANAGLKVEAESVPSEHLLAVPGEHLRGVRRDLPDGVREEQARGEQVQDDPRSRSQFK